MTASFGIAMIGVASLLVIPLIIYMTRSRNGKLDLSGLLIIALVSAIASCVASHP